MRVLVCGGAGFIGSCFVRRLLSRRPEAEVVTLDKLTYAGNLENLGPALQEPRHVFVQGDICDREALEKACRGVDAIVNFAAETHVDRSILDPGSFIRTDVLGTQTLLEAAREAGVSRFVQVSTDEVYGPVGKGSSKETDVLKPSSPYSASKAGGDLIAMAYHRTYSVPVMVTRGSNTYGPYQYPEKLIPLAITNALLGQKVPVYGDGSNVRDWVHVDDHVGGIELVLDKGEPGGVYNVGGGNEQTNLGLLRILLDELGLTEDAIEFVRDRPGHDHRYSLDSSKLQGLGWRPATELEAGLRATVRWYRDNERWWRKTRDKAFTAWQESWYER